jgi:hypothetical protein
VPEEVNLIPKNAASRVDIFNLLSYNYMRETSNI